MPAETVFDYIVVGSGAGGGPLACNLAKAGFKVGLVEAGRDPARLEKGGPNYNYLIPALHGQATEDPELSWAFYVNHYPDTDPNRQRKNSKYQEDGPLKTGVFYPRAQGIGGCTTHNAMITVYPHNEDWEYIRKLTGDDSWSAERMRSYFEKLEDCRYRPASPNEGRHGFGGWLPTNLPDPFLAARDTQLQKVALAAVKTFLRKAVEQGGPATELEKLGRLLKAIEPHVKMASAALSNMPAVVQPLLLNALGKINQLKAVVEQSPNLKIGVAESLLSVVPGLSLNDAVSFFMHFVPIEQLIPTLIRHVDPNDWRVATGNLTGIFATPLATNGFVRRGPREHILNTSGEFPNRLFILTDTFATKVVFDGNKAVGVEIIEQPFAYGASPRSDATIPSKERIMLRANREVILAGGTFNTPQLLMLSGVGPETELTKHGIHPVIAGKYWNGVGQKLQDRYEVGVISEMKEDFAILQGCKFEAPQGDGSDDPCFVQWQEKESGVYTSNGVVISIIVRSQQAETPAPDIFIFGLPGYFKGYFPQYSDEIAKTKNSFTWAILKGHTRNHAGSVTLRSSDPLVPPVIQFNYFDAGSPGHAKDLEALVEAVAYVDDVMKATGEARTTTAIPNVPLNDKARLREYITNEAWGHHACGTCRMGLESEGAVVDSQFRVHGLQNLRIVDASVFPKIPGFFIVTPIYMISEKASDVIIADARA